MAIMQETAFNEQAWEMREFDWAGKSFYFLEIKNVLGKPIGLGKKLEELNRDLRMHGYRTVNSMILIQHASFKGRIMIEVEKQDKYDAQVTTFEDTTTVDTLVHKGPTGGLRGAIKRIQQRVSSRRGMNPRAIYYWLVDGPGSERCVIFAIT